MDIREANLEEVWQLRHHVMWPGKPIDFVKLEDDPEGLHFGLYNRERLVSVISLFLNGEEAQFRKFATLPEEQGKGYGSKLLAYTLEESKQRGAVTVWCNARKSKVDFYSKFGLQATDRIFEKAGVEYVILQGCL